MNSQIRVALISALMLIAAPAPCQTTGDDLSDLRPVMARLQTAECDAEGLRTVVTALVAKGRTTAAAWWLALGEEAFKRQKPSATAASVVADLRRITAKATSDTEDQKAATRVLRHLESLVSYKEFDEAKRLAPWIEALDLTTPEAALGKSAEPTIRKLADAKSTGNQDAQNLARLTKAWDALEPPTRDLFARRSEAVLAEYEAAGCRPGRTVVSKVIASGVAARLVNADCATALTKRLNAATRKREPTRALTVLLRQPSGTVRVWRNGDEAAEFEGSASFPATNTKPITLEVSPGELIQFEFDTAFSGGSKDDALFLVATHANIGSVVLSKKDWFRNGDSDPHLLSPKLKSEPVVHRGTAKQFRLSSGSGDKDAGDAEAGMYFRWSLGNQVTLLHSTPEQDAIEAEFKKENRTPLWLGSSCKKLVLVLRVPDDARPQ